MKKSEALAIIGAKVAQCRRCGEIAEYREAHQYLTCPGDGHPNARLMIIGEGPGEAEAKSGACFVGSAGQLLSNIIAACGWKREDIFITNILRCRPPGNRDPSEHEARNCRPFLDLQIRCVDPDFIICLGRIASVYLLGVSPDRSMRSLRGIHQYQERTVVATFHPSYALRNPAAKQEIWSDLQPIIESMKTASLR